MRHLFQISTSSDLSQENPSFDNFKKGVLHLSSPKTCKLVMFDIFVGDKTMLVRLT